MCLVCFLSTEYQRNLRSIAQLQTDKFEITLNTYKKLFLSSYSELEDSNFCGIHSQYDTLFTSSFKKEFRKIVSNCFDAIISSYINWIDGKTAGALVELDNLLKSYSIYSSTYNVENLIFYRGRQCTGPLSQWDMFHIPFNKRYLIKNQRYSLSGQPILYLSLSPLSVVREIFPVINGKTDLSSLKIASFTFSTEGKANKKILDIRNPFDYLSRLNDILLFTQTNSLSAKIDFLAHQDKSLYLYNTLQRLIIQTIVHSCCSFCVKDGYQNYFFIEEYILPQLISQLSKERGFDGIIYSSTKKYGFDYALKDLLDNVALFTNFDSSKKEDASYVYDKSLYPQFNISRPLSLAEKLDITNETIDYTVNLIQNNIDEVIKNQSFYQTLNAIDTYKRLLPVNIVEDKKNKMYFDTTVGKIHKFMLYNEMIEFKNKIFC